MPFLRGIKMQNEEKTEMKFDDKLARIEEINKLLSDGKIDLESSVSLFEEGMKLSKSMEADLSKLERRIEIITNDPDPDSSEGLQAEPFVPEEGSSIRK